MAMIELVDFNELYNADKPKKKTTRRSRRGGSKPATPPPVDVKASNEEE
jgi:large subunit ribosomal protein L17